eukprot:g21795.t1
MIIMVKLFFTLIAFLLALSLLSCIVFRFAAWKVLKTIEKIKKKKQTAKQAKVDRKLLRAAKEQGAIQSIKVVRQLLEGKRKASFKPDGRELARDRRLRREREKRERKQNLKSYGEEEEEELEIQAGRPGALRPMQILPQKQDETNPLDIDDDESRSGRRTVKTPRAGRMMRAMRMEKRRRGRVVLPLCLALIVLAGHWDFVGPNRRGDWGEVSE